MPANLKFKPGAVIHPIYKWDAQTNLCKEFDAGLPSSSLSALALSPNDQWLAEASGWSGNLILVETNSGRTRLLHDETMANQYTSLAFSPDSQLLAGGTLGGAVRACTGGQQSAAHGLRIAGLQLPRAPASASKAGPPPGKPALKIFGFPGHFSQRRSGARTGHRRGATAGGPPENPGQA